MYLFNYQFVKKTGLHKRTVPAKHTPLHISTHTINTEIQHCKNKTIQQRKTQLYNYIILYIKKKSVLMSSN